MILRAEGMASSQEGIDDVWASDGFDKARNKALSEILLSKRSYTGVGDSECMAWPFKIQFSSFNQESGAISGQIELPTLNSIVRFDGKVLNKTLFLKTTAYIIKGPAVIGADWRLSLVSNEQMEGTWSHQGRSGKITISFKQDIKPILFPKLKSRGTDLYISELPKGSKKIILREFPKRSYGLISDYIEEDMDVRIALWIDITNNGKQDLLVITDNIRKASSSAVRRSEGFVLVDFTERQPALKKATIFRENGKNSDFGYNSTEYVAYRIGDSIFFACVFYWRAEPYLAVVYQAESGSFLEAVE